MISQFGLNKKYGIIMVAIIISVIIGLGTTIFFLWTNMDSYSSLYIIPDSIVHDSNNNSVFYTYGVQSSESGSIDYVLSEYLNSTLIKTKKFTLNKGESLNERDMISLPLNITYPSKVSLILTTKKEQEEVHFWVGS